MNTRTIIQKFSISGIYEHYSSGGPGSHPGAKTGFIHRTMYFPHQDDAEISRIIDTHSRFVILIQQNEYAVSLFQRGMMPLIHKTQKPYVIISCMDDMTFPDEVVGSFFYSVAHQSTSLSLSLFRRWFAINCRSREYSPGFTDNKITPIPYGIDYSTLTRRSSWTNTPMASATAQDRHLSRLCSSVIHFTKRPLTDCVYINFQFNLDGNGGGERNHAFQTIPRDVMSIQETPCNRYDTWGAYSQHAFVVSPRGNGIDTIRTWEALMLGCIVIVRRIAAHTLPIEELYTDLPVVIIDTWSEVTREFLSRILSEFAKRSANNEFRYEKLSMKYWIEQIESAFDTGDFSV
jgi:hypothetical protein